MKKVFIPVIAAVMLAGCEKNIPEVTEQISETEIAAALFSESITEECTAEAVGEASAETEAEEVEDIKVIPADEVYDVYPMRIIYPERIETDIAAKEAEVNEEFKNGEVVVYKFSAAYPVFSGGDENVMRKINEYIKNHVDEIYNKLERETAMSDTSEFDIDGDFPYRMCGFMYERAFDGGYGETVLCDVNGNILSVYFEDYSYGAGAMHGIETPAPMVFDLRSGERVDFNKIISDVDGLSEVLSKALYDYLYTDPYSTWHDVPDNYAEYNDKRIKGDSLPDDWVEFGFDGEGDYVAALRKANDRMTVRDGCLCFYLAGYEYGSYADGIRRIDVPVNDVLQYLTEEGQMLFAGFASAESKPVNIVSENGVKSFDTGDEWEEPHLYFSDKPGRS